MCLTDSCQLTSVRLFSTPTNTTVVQVLSMAHQSPESFYCLLPPVCQSVLSTLLKGYHYQHIIPASLFEKAARIPDPRLKTRVRHVD